MTPAMSPPASAPVMLCRGGCVPSGDTVVLVRTLRLSAGVDRRQASGALLQSLVAHVRASRHQKMAMRTNVPATNPTTATRIALLLGVATLVLAGCGGDKGQDGGVSSTTSSTATALTTATTTASTTAPTTTSATASSAAKITVPHVVGKDLQFAQDTMQAAGLYNLRSHDSTGQGRLQVLDRNWQVTDQTPAAGSKVSEDQLIDLGARKFTD